MFSDDDAHLCYLLHINTCSTRSLYLFDKFKRIDIIVGVGIFFVLTFDDSYDHFDVSTSFFMLLKKV